MEFLPGSREGMVARPTLSSSLSVRRAAGMHDACMHTHTLTLLLQVYVIDYKIHDEDEQPSLFSPADEREDWDYRDPLQSTSERIKSPRLVRM